jgi:hypothetical protein
VLFGTGVGGPAPVTDPLIWRLHASTNPLSVVDLVFMLTFAPGAQMVPFITRDPFPLEVTISFVQPVDGPFCQTTKPPAAGETVQVLPHEKLIFPPPLTTNVALPLKPSTMMLVLLPPVTQ